MPYNLNITLQFLCHRTGAQALVQCFIWGLIRVLYIFKTIFASLAIKFLTIQSIIPFAHNTIDKISLSALNVSSKPTPKLHSSFSFLIYLLFNSYSILLFLYAVHCTWYFSILNLNFQISSQYDNLSKYIYIISFDNGLTL